MTEPLMTPITDDFSSPATMASHCLKVMQGEYYTPFITTLPENFIVVDIGGNIGSFAYWALTLFNNCTVTTYEPSTANYAMLQKNLAKFGDRVSMYNFGVGDPIHTELFTGLNNCGEASFFELGEQGTTSETVVVKDPSVVPKAHLLKIDTEGCEVEIMSKLNLSDYTIIMFEYHSEADRRLLDGMLDEFTLIGADSGRAQRGVMKYMRTDALNKATDDIVNGAK